MFHLRGIGASSLRDPIEVILRWAPVHPATHGTVRYGWPGGGAGWVKLNGKCSRTSSIADGWLHDPSHRQDPSPDEIFVRDRPRGGRDHSDYRRRGGLRGLVCFPQAAGCCEARPAVATNRCDGLRLGRELPVENSAPHSRHQTEKSSAFGVGAEVIRMCTHKGTLT